MTIEENKLHRIPTSQPNTNKQEKGVNPSQSEKPCMVNRRTPIPKYVLSRRDKSPVPQKTLQVKTQSNTRSMQTRAQKAITRECSKKSEGTAKRRFQRSRNVLKKNSDRALKKKVPEVSVAPHETNPKKGPKVKCN